MSTGTPAPGADQMRLRQIATWHARGQDTLDGYGIPRSADGLEFTIAERIELLAGRPPAPRPTGQIRGGHDHGD